MDKEELLLAARKIQRVHFKTFDGSSYDKLPRNSLNKFIEILLFYMTEKEALLLSEKIFQGKSELIFRIIIVHCIVNRQLANSPVIRVLENSRPVFYDITGRKYHDWNGYLLNNKLPEGMMIFPINGSYSQEDGEVKLDEKKSPASELSHKVDKIFYTAADVVSLIALAMPMFSFAKPYANYVIAASAVSNGYKAGHHGYQLYDRYKHGQPIDLSDKDSMRDWSHIGNAFLSFALTTNGAIYGDPNPQNDVSNLTNLFKLVLMENAKGNVVESCSLLRKRLLSQCLMDFKENHANILMKVKIDPETLVSTYKLFVGGKSSAFRKLIEVDGTYLQKVIQDIKVCQNISTVKLDAHEFAWELENSVVHKVVEEASSWKLLFLSDNQLKFRVKGICDHGQRAYETIEELFHCYSANSVEEISVNDKLIFKNIGEQRAKLEELVLNASKNFPQLLYYAVEYAAANAHDPVDWDNFKPYFIGKLTEDCSSFIDCRATISWMNISTLEEVSRCSSGDGIFFVRPSNSAVIRSQDLINLVKKFLGVLSFPPEDVLITCKWTVLVSKTKRRIICVGPKIDGCSSFKGCYPVFVKPL